MTKGSHWAGSVKGPKEGDEIGATLSGESREAQHMAQVKFPEFIERYIRAN